MSDRNTFYCFTPLVTLITFIIEVAFAFYVFLRYRKSLFGKLSIIFLLLLGIFQLSEYSICGGGHSLLWSKVGYLTITFLPVIGLHLISLVTKKSRLLKSGYVIAAIFAVIILIVPGIFLGVSCTGRYLIFDTSDIFDYFYVIYYVGFLLIGLFKLFYSWARGTGNRYIIKWIMIGYLLFMIPMLILYVFVSSTQAAVPSIMCGFALLAAIVSVGKILPHYKGR